MANPFIGQIALFPYSFAPKGWALCQGQVLAIASNSSLASLLGTNFGGDGRTTFGLPDLRGRAAIGAVPWGQGAMNLGTMVGTEQVQITDEAFGHGHSFNCSSGAGTTNTVTGNQFAVGRGGDPQKPEKANIYNPDESGTPPVPNADAQLGSDSGTVPTTGGDRSHNNMQPYLTMNYCIALQGIMPPRH